MAKPHLRITRRQMLRSASGFAVGLPFLPSLVPGRAWAQEVSFDPGKRFVAITTNHGGVYEASMFPSESALTETTPLYPGMSVRRGALQRTVNGGRASLSPVLTANDTVLTEALAAKMNVMFGLDIPFYIAHHTGGHLGNYARNDGNGSDGQSLHQLPMPTIDQLMAWSPSFYTDLSNVTVRTLIGGSRGGFSWNWSNPSTRSGNIQEVPPEYDLGWLFEQVFVPESTMPAEPVVMRTPVVDRVLEAYRSLRQSNRRIDAADRQRLDDHVDRLAELQRRVNATPVRLATCQGFNEPNADRSDFVEYHRALNEVVTAAFLCGTSRIAVIGVVEEQYANYVGDWHQEIAHQWFDNNGPQAALVDVNQQVFEHVFADLAYRLDVEESPGVTVLDNTLVSWSQESGVSTHDSRALPVVTAGSAGGFFRTGQYCDYRNRVNGSLLFRDTPDSFTGLPYAQWLATCLQAMGLPASEWQNVANNGAAGYGYPLVDSSYGPTHVSGVMANASEVLPFLRA